MSRRLGKDDLLPALRAWVYVSGYGGPLAESVPQALGWLRALWEQGFDALPLDLVHDLGMLLADGRGFPFASSRDLAAWPDDERDPRLDYEDRVLGRWILDPSLLDAHVAISGLHDDLRPRAIAHAIGLALGTAARAADGVAGNPAILRGVMPAALAMARAWPARFGAWDAAPVDPAWRDWAARQRAAILACRGEARLFSAQDLWELAHLADLPSESTRLALREIHAVAAAIGGVPPGVAMRVKRRAQQVAVDDDDASHYPMGGFDALSTQGRFENLVRTEVAYVREAADMLGGIDLFDVRFAQGELLYYTRDESPLYDQHRRLTLVLDAPAEQRHKHPELAAQTLVLVDAAALRLQSDMLQVFGPNGAEVHLRWRLHNAADREVAEEEERLVALTLADDIAHRRVTTAAITDWTEVSARGLVVFAAHGPDPRSPPPGHEQRGPAAASGRHTAQWVRVGDRRWHLGDASFDIAEPGSLRALLDALLVRLFE
jgi:hypothetical protein